MSRKGLVNRANVYSLCVIVTCCIQCNSKPRTLAAKVNDSTQTPELHSKSKHIDSIEYEGEKFIMLISEDAWNPTKLMLISNRPERASQVLYDKDQKGHKVKSPMKVESIGDQKYLYFSIQYENCLYNCYNNKVLAFYYYDLNTEKLYSEIYRGDFVEEGLRSYIVGKFEKEIFTEHKHLGYHFLEGLNEDSGIACINPKQVDHIFEEYDYERSGEVYTKMKNMNFFCDFSDTPEVVEYTTHVIDSADFFGDWIAVYKDEDYNSFYWDDYQGMELHNDGIYFFDDVGGGSPIPSHFIHQIKKVFRINTIDTHSYPPLAEYELLVSKNSFPQKDTLDQTDRFWIRLAVESEDQAVYKFPPNIGFNNDTFVHESFIYSLTRKNEQGEIIENDRP